MYIYILLYIFLLHFTGLEIVYRVGWELVFFLEEGITFVSMQLENSNID